MGYFSNLSVSIIEAWQSGVPVPDIADQFGIADQEVQETVRIWCAGDFDQDPPEQDTWVKMVDRALD